MIRLADPSPDLSAHLTAGRRAAIGAVIIEAKRQGYLSYNGPNPDTAMHGYEITLNGIDIGPAIDAAVMETIVRLEHPDVAAVPRKRRWWRFWR